LQTALCCLLAGTFFSCNKFLDKEPLTQITPDNFFSSETNAAAAVAGAYSAMEHPYAFGQSWIIVPEFSARHVVHTALYPEYMNFSQNTVLTNNPWAGNIWTYSFAAINAANEIIKRVPEMAEGTISEDSKTRFTGEARFIRAFNYFYLVRAFGGVPLLTEPTNEESNLNRPRATADSVYAQIIADLQEAVKLPESYSTTDETKGRATGIAAKALLAKVYLYRKQYDQAAALSNEVMNSGLSLPADFSSVWTQDNATESIFELQFSEQSPNPLAGVSNDNASVLFLASDTVYKMYEDGDKRRDYTTYQGSKDRYFIGKYRQFSPATQNIPIIRLAEILLIHAEAQARTDNAVSADAYNAYKMVRDRAGLTTPDAATFTSVDAFVTAVQHEKRLEMMFEGEAWFDYCRTGLALTEMMAKPDPKYYLYPIPQSEIIVNPALTQNPGY